MARRYLMTLGALLIGLSSFAQPADAQNRTPDRRVITSTGLVRLRPGKAVRMSLVEIDGKRAKRQATLRVIDDRRRTVSTKRGDVSPTKALFLDLKRSNISESYPSAFPVRFEAEIICSDREYGPTLTVEVFDEQSGRIESVDDCGNPCCPTCGPPLPLPAIPSCPTLEFPITSGSNR
ncbi:MAG: hypothetical protein AAFN74_12405 [Myxococcota bacterium]